MTQGFYNGRRILVTGHSGFKGAWLSLWLSILGARLFGVSLHPPSSPYLAEAIDLDSMMPSESVDIRDSEHIEKLLNDVQPEVVFHLAAQPLVRDSYVEPVGTFSTNVLGTVNLLEAVRKTPSVKVAVIVTSDKCYENREWVYPYREVDRLGGFDPYSASKACAEIAVDSYRRAFFDGGRTLGLATVRAGNVIGGGDWARDRLVPDIVRAITNKTSLAVRYPEACRPWQHVVEPLSGYLWLARQLWYDPVRFSLSWNFGPELHQADVSVGDIVERVHQLWGAGEWHIIPGKHSHEASHLTLDISWARERLGWRPVWNLEEALFHTVEWYKQYYNGGLKMRKLTEDHIEEYTRDARLRKMAWAADGIF